MVFIEQNALMIGIALIIISLIIINMRQFKFQKRITITLAGLGLLFFGFYFGPSLGFTIDLKSDLPYYFFTIISTSFLSDIIFKKKVDF